MQEFSLVNQINKAVRKLDMVLTLEFHRPAGLWQQQEPCYTSRLHGSRVGKWTVEVEVAVESGKWNVDRGEPKPPDRPRRSPCRDGHIACFTQVQTTWSEPRI